MPDSKAPVHLRKWETIAQELCQETNPKRILELSHELTDAIDEQALPVRPKQYLPKMPPTHY